MTDHPFAVLLAHPDTSRRALYERKLARAPELEVVGSVAELGDAVERVVELLPDVAMLTAGEGLLDAVTRIDDEAPTTAILVLEPRDDDFAAVRAGAFGALPPGSSELTRAAVGVARNECVLTPGWALALLEAITDLDERVRRRILLSETEREVLGRIANGESSTAIADLYEVPERLVNLHVGYTVTKYQRAVEAQAALDRYEEVRAGHDA